jgi:uncharacterized protein (TIGR00369 family)
MSQFIVHYEDYAKRIQESFARQGFMKYLGAELTSIEPGTVEIEVPYSKNITQQHDFFHGGVIGTIADNAGGYSAFTLMAATDSILTVEYKLNIMSPANGEKLIARGKVLRPGRKITTCKSDIFVVRDGKEKLCATMLGTFMTLENASDGPVKD